MSGFTPGTPDFNAAVAYYADLHYANPSLLAKNGLTYYTDSPAWREFIKAAAAPASSTSLGKYRGNQTGTLYTAWDIDAESGTAPNGETVTEVEARVTTINWLYDPSADLSFLRLREGESVQFNPGDGSDASVGQWVLDTPAIQNITRGLTWSDVRAGIEFVGVALGLAYVGGELLAPEAAAAGEIAAPTAAEALVQPEVIDIFGTVAGASEPAIDVAAFTGSEVAVAGSAAGTGAATIAADAGVPAAAIPGAAAAPAIPSALSNAVASLANSAVGQAIRNAIAPSPKPATAAPVQPAAPAADFSLPLLVVGGIAVKLLFFS